MKMKILIFSVALCVVFNVEPGLAKDKRERAGLMTLTMTSLGDTSDGIERIKRSASIYDLELKVLKKDEEGKSSFRTMKEEVERLSANRGLVIIIVDGATTIFNGGEKDLLEKFHELHTDIVFGAYDQCPYPEFMALYPQVPHKYKYLNTGVIMGYAPSLHDLLAKIDDESDVRRQVHSAYLNDTLRKEIDMKLDHKAQLIQIIFRNQDDVRIVFPTNEAKVYNKLSSTEPSIIHGVGEVGNVALMGLGNYLAKSYNKNDGCRACLENKINMDALSEKEYPKVLIGVFVETPTPFFDQMLQKVLQLNYPQKKIFLYLYSKFRPYDTIIMKWIKLHGKKYKSVKFTPSSENVSAGDAKHIAIETTLEANFDIFFNVDSFVHLDNPDTLRLLISYNRTIIAPIMIRPNSLWSTFWGSVRGNYYKRSFDYVNIIEGNIKGIWNVPYIYGVYMIWRRLLEDPTRKIDYRTFNGQPWATDMAFTLNNRINQIFMYAANLDDYGHLININKANTERTKTDLWQLEISEDWEDKYIFGDMKTLKYTKICEGVYTFQLFTNRFCKNFLQTVLDYKKKCTTQINQVSEFYAKIGRNIIPVRMNDIHYWEQWKIIVNKYMMPFLKEIYDYEGKGEPKMNVVAEYQNLEESLLLKYEPSKYTVRVSLNTFEKDYQGPGYKFLKQDCPAITLNKGEALVYPSEMLMKSNLELSVTEGSKYDIISYIQEDD